MTAMNVSPQQHFDRTGWYARASVMSVILVAVGVAVALNAERRYAASLVAKSAIAFAARLLAWPGAIFGELVAEILRECTTARCTKCSGKPKAFAIAVPPIDATAPKPHYACQTCGHVDPIILPKVGYSFEFNNSNGGLGGGG